MSGELYAVTRTQHAAEIVFGKIRFEAQSPRIEKGEVKTTLSVWNGSLLHHASTNLTNDRARARLIKILGEKNVVVSDDMLVALEQGCRREAPKQEKPAV